MKKEELIWCLIAKLFVKMTGFCYQPIWDVRGEIVSELILVTVNSINFTNVTEDPGQSENLAEKYPEKVKALHGKLAELKK